jgi:hypothetical protein
MVGIAEEPPRQLAPSVGSATPDSVIRARSVIIINIIITGSPGHAAQNPRDFSLKGSSQSNHDRDL